MSDTVSSDCVECKIKTPKKVVHFSDGVVEEYDNNSTDEDRIQTDQTDKQIVSGSMISNVKQSVLWFGTQSLKVCDYLGEGLANFFGITSPKYESEIDEYMRRVADEESYKNKQLSEFSGWSSTDTADKTYINCMDTKDIPRNNYSIDIEKQRY